MRTLAVVLLLFPLLSFAQTKESNHVPDLNELQQMTARFAPTPINVDTSKLSAGDKQALVKLVEAARIVNELFMKQMWSQNLVTWQKVKADQSPLGQARAHYYWINKCPWSALDEQMAFLPDVPERKLLGANFYPEDMTKVEFETWVKTLSAKEQEEATGFFTVVRRNAEGQAKAGSVQR